MSATTQARVRLLHPTPGRLVLALLVVECLLWLSERFGWLAWHKGYAVLTGVAAVGVAAFVLLIWFAGSLLSQWQVQFRMRTLLLAVLGLLLLEALLPQFLDVFSQPVQIAQIVVGLALLATLCCFAAVRLIRRPFQFGIRALLVLVIAVAVPCSWLAVEMKKAREQKEAAEVIVKLGRVTYDQFNSDNPFSDEEPPFPTWLRRLLGDNFFKHVNSVVVADGVGLEQIGTFKDLAGLELYATDARLARLKGLTQLKRLKLNGDEFSDNGLVHLKELPHLQDLDLSHTSVTDRGLVRVKELPCLDYLDLSGTQITDAGLEYLAELHLHVLRLGGKSITDAGLAKLKGSADLMILSLVGTDITDASLRYLTSFRQLEELDLRDTEFTDAGVDYLIWLEQLQELDLRKTKVTDAGVARLQNALPNCTITH